METVEKFAGEMDRKKRSKSASKRHTPPACDAVMKAVGPQQRLHLTASWGHTEREKAGPSTKQRSRDAQAQDPATGTGAQGGAPS